MEKIESSGPSEQIGTFKFFSFLRESKDIVATALSQSKRIRLKRYKEMIEDNYDIPSRDLWNDLPDSKIGPEYAPSDTRLYQCQREEDALTGLQKAESIHQSLKYRIPFLFCVFFAAGAVGGIAVYYLTAIFPVIEEAIIRTIVYSLTLLFCALLAGLLGFIKFPFAKLFLPKRLMSDKQIEFVKKTANDVIYKDFINEDTPADLRDHFRLKTVDSKSRPVDGQIPSAEDPVFYKTLILGLALSSFVSFIAFIAGLLATYPEFQQLLAPLASSAEGELAKLINMGATLLLGTVYFCLAAITVVAIFIYWKVSSPFERFVHLSKTLVAYSTQLPLIDQAGAAHFKTIESALRNQVTDAGNDKSVFINLGKSTGWSASRRNPFAPTIPGLPFGLTLNDLSTHFIGLGDTGTGKTTGLVRPIVAAVMQASKAETNGRGVGMLVLDGKGPLPYELVDLDPNYQVIHPTHVELNPIQNLDPDEVAQVFYDLGTRDSDGSDRFWDDQALRYLRACANCVKAFRMPWTLRSILEATVDDALMKNVRKQFDEYLADRNTTMEKVLSPAEQSAFNFRFKEFSKIPEKTQGSIRNIVSGWLAAITDHKKLAEWAMVEEGAQIESVANGKRIGIAMPESEFGQAGLLVSLLSKKRLYKHIKNRGDKWREMEGETAVLMVADEVQVLITEDELDMLPIARSLGLYCAFFTQNVDGLDVALGSYEKTNQLLGNIRSVATLPVSTVRSQKAIEEAWGYQWKAIAKDFNGLVDMENEANAIRYNSADAVLKRSTMRFESMSSGGVSRSVTHILTKAIELIPSLSRDESLHREQQPSISVGTFPKVQREEVKTVLCDKNTALISLNRAGVVRQDLVILNPIYRTEA